MGVERFGALVEAVLKEFRKNRRVLHCGASFLWGTVHWMEAIALSTGSTLSLTGKRWRIQDDARLVLPSGRSEWCRSILDHFLQGRSIGTTGALSKTLCGYPARLFPDVPRAVDRIRSAVAAKERVAVFGDYDCDGITATALLARYCKRRGVEPKLRLPHRLHEGYGLKENVIRECKDAGVTLLITVDTGITAVREIALANEAGIDVIVVDHHRVPEELPEAYALLHPALLAAFPEPHPAAAGVAWTLVRALEEADGLTDWEGSDTDCALAAIGTVADLVELRGGNRSLVEQGLRSLQRIDQGPLALLRLQSGLLNAPATSRDIAFRIAPRLNAAGRMAEPDIALRALLGDEQSVLRLEELNRHRQELVATLVETVLKETDLSAPFLCIRHASYAAGICGLIAGKLTERFGRPSLVAHDQGAFSVASLRSIPGYDVTNALRTNADLLLSFGGHAMAAGCSFASASFETLQARLAEDIRQRMPAEDLVPTLQIDAVVSAHHLCLELCEALQTLEPYGQGNTEPRFLVSGITLSEMRCVGRDSSHLQAVLQDKKLIGFGYGRFMDSLRQPIDLVCTLGIDEWQGRRKAQLQIEDLRISS